MVDSTPRAGAKAPRVKKPKSALPVEPIPSAKELLRKKLSAEWAVKFPEVRSGRSKEAENQLCQKVTQSLADEFGVWAGFQSFGFEPNLQKAIQLLPQIQWAFPRVEGNRLDFFIPNGSDSFLANQWGILEPDPSRSRAVNPFDLDGLLVPGVAFDLNCFRLGRGAGFYDRLLKFYDESGMQAPVSVGVCFDEQIVETGLPADSHDQKLSGVLTDRRTIGQFFVERDE